MVRSPGFLRGANDYPERVTSEPPSLFADTALTAKQVAWVYQVIGETQLIADLAFADTVIWAPTTAGRFVAASHVRPSSAATLFYRDVVGSECRPEWLGLVKEALETGSIIDSKAPESFDGVASRVRAVPIRTRRRSDGGVHDDQPFAVMTKHSNLSESRIPSRQELAFRECANDLLAMVADGTFPDPDTPSAPAQGAPRASDGLIRLDVTGKVTFASPNALSGFRRLGFDEELEDTVLAEVAAKLLQGTLIVDESLPLVVTGRAPWRTDLEARGVTMTLRAIPLKREGNRIGAIILSRDVTQLRLRDQEMITKDATIREIHHRVKNNLQTVASLLRIQSRRTRSDAAKDALNQAMRRVAAIAVVHDTLSEGLSQNVDFDTVFERVLMLVAEVASGSTHVVKPKTVGSFGILPSEYATPLALVLTELVTNAVEHGLAGKKNGEVVITASRSDDRLSVTVRDNGGGLPEGKVGEGLGTQIVRTLVHGELGGSIDWHTLEEEGTEVTIEIPLQYLHEKDVLVEIPTV